MTDETIAVDHTTARIALMALRDSVDTDLTAADVELAIDDLRDGLESPGVRTSLTRSGVFETLDIPEVPANTVVLDYQLTSPRLLVHLDSTKEPTLTITLPTDCRPSHRDQ